MVSDSDLVAQLREILRSSDLDTTTPATVRRQLEAYFGVELTDKKAFLTEQIDAFLETEAVFESKPENHKEEKEGDDDEDCNGDQNGEERSENDDEKTERPEKAKKRRGGFNKICQLSPQLEKFLGTPQLARTEVVKKMWAYIREHDLQDPKNRRNILCDESLHSLFRVKTIDMFQMNKALAKHIWPLNDADGCVKNVKEEDEDETSRKRDEKEDRNEEARESSEEESGEEDPSVRKPESHKEEEEGDDDEDRNGDKNGDEGSENDDEKTESPVKAKKRRGGFNKICQLSPQLEKFLGTSQLARTEVVKKMWAYIREHQLQDPKNRQNILCDESLHFLFRVKTINMFQMNKALAKHIWPLNDGDGCVKNVKEEDEDETSGERDEKEDQNEEARETNEEDSGEEVCSVRKRKRKKRKSAKSEETPKKKGGGFTKVCSLSPELQAFTGTPQLARTEVVKMLWKYIKENNLQDPSDKRTIICDKSLQSLFPVESINMFQMNKQLAKHIWPLVHENEAGSTNDPEKEKQKMKMEIDEGTTDDPEKGKQKMKMEIDEAGLTNDPEKGKQKMKMEIDEAGATNDPEKGEQKMKMEIDEDEANEKEATSPRIKTEQ